VHTAALASPAEKAGQFAGNNLMLVNHDEMPSIPNTDEASIRNIPGEPLTVFDRLKRIVFAPDNQGRCGDLRQEVSELCGQVRVQCGRIADLTFLGAVARGSVSSTRLHRQ
jgi:hypothetical protein